MNTLNITELGRAKMLCESLVLDIKKVLELTDSSGITPAAKAATAGMVAEGAMREHLDRITSGMRGVSFSAIAATCCAAGVDSIEREVARSRSRLRPGC